MAANPFQQHIDSLTVQLKALLPAALTLAGYPSSQHNAELSLHAIIGGKNNVYVDAIRQVFLSPQQFIDEWKAGVLKNASDKDAHELTTYGHRYQTSAAHRIIRWLQEPILLQYTELFLERNFYRQYYARIRSKPEDALWELWFGPKNQEYGLFITPRHQNGQWENDVSEIRRSKFEYWTIGHVLASGFVVPGQTAVYSVSTLDDLFNLYRNVFLRVTGSVYSQQFGAAYETYVRGQRDPGMVPFLIPEFRYEGATGPHKYRLDFAVLSASGNWKIGIELSPWSTHGRVAGKKKLREQGGEAAIEDAQMAKWEADTQKRNDYFLKFGISTLTFTDTHLTDVTTAFTSLVPYLIPATTSRVAGPQMAQAIQQYSFD